MSNVVWLDEAWIWVAQVAVLFAIIAHRYREKGKMCSSTLLWLGVSACAALIYIARNW